MTANAPQTTKSKPKITLSYQDRIIQCKQQALSDWEHSFLSSVYSYCQSYNFRGLSDKQEKKLEDIERDCILSKYYNADGSKPFKEDKEDMKAIKGHDTEDDMPF